MPMVFCGQKKFGPSHSFFKGSIRFRGSSLRSSLILTVPLTVCASLLFTITILQIKWHPYLLNPSAPKEGLNKEEFYKNKFGSRSGPIIARMTEVFALIPHIIISKLFSVRIYWFSRICRFSGVWGWSTTFLVSRKCGIIMCGQILF